MAQIAELPGGGSAEHLRAFGLVHVELERRKSLLAVGPGLLYHSDLRTGADLARDQRLEIVATEVRVKDRRAGVEPLHAAAGHVESQHVRLAGIGIAARHRLASVPDAVDGAVLRVGRVGLELGGLVAIVIRCAGAELFGIAGAHSITAFG